MTETSARGGWSVATRRKAERMDPDRIRQDVEHDTIWWVLSEDGWTSYRVQLIELAAQVDDSLAEPSLVSICSCKHGMNNGGAAWCYHTAAAARRAGIL